jgi:hypothetical protein
MKELSEDSKFQVSLKTLGGIVVLIVTLVGMWFTLQADIDEAKLLPEMPISEKEFELKDKLIRASILSTQEDVKEIKEDMKYLRNKMDNVN